MSTVYICADCPAEISWGGTRCRSCAASHRYRSPEARAKTREAIMRVHERNPDVLDRFREIGRAKLTEQHAARKAAGLPHPRKGWRKFACPEDRQADYERLRKKVGVKEAQRMILEDIAADAIRARAAVEKSQRAMIEKHQRDLASRY